MCYTSTVALSMALWLHGCYAYTDVYIIRLFYSTKNIHPLQQSTRRSASGESSLKNMTEAGLEHARSLAFTSSIYTLPSTHKRHTRNAAPSALPH